MGKGKVAPAPVIVFCAFADGLSKYSVAANKAKIFFMCFPL
jgi:hypothetical protein